MANFTHGRRNIEIQKQMLRVFFLEPMFYLSQGFKIFDPPENFIFFKKSNVETEFEAVSSFLSESHRSHSPIDQSNGRKWARD